MAHGCSKKVAENVGLALKIRDISLHHELEFLGSRKTYLFHTNALCWGCGEMACPTGYGYVKVVDLCWQPGAELSKTYMCYDTRGCRERMEAKIFQASVKSEETP